MVRSITMPLPTGTSSGKPIVMVIPANYNNWFYMISDDNILYLNTANENIEYRLLYNDLQGSNHPHCRTGAG